MRGFIVTEHMTQEEKLDKFINFIQGMGNDLDMVMDHALTMENFWGGMGDQLFSVSRGSGRVVFNGDSRETEDMRKCQEEWEEVKATLNTYVGVRITFLHGCKRSNAKDLAVNGHDNSTDRTNHNERYTVSLNCGLQAEHEDIPIGF